MRVQVVQLLKVPSIGITPTEEVRLWIKPQWHQMTATEGSQWVWVQVIYREDVATAGIFNSSL